MFGFDRQMGNLGRFRKTSEDTHVVEALIAVPIWCLPAR